MTDQEIRDRLSDVDALTVTLFVEGRGEPVEGRIAVGCVIRNRLTLPRRFGATYRAVCLQRAQFSGWWKNGGAANYELSYRLGRACVEQAGLAPQPPLAGVELEIFVETQFLSEGVMAGHLRDRVRGATHYYNPDAMIPRGRVPEWAAGLRPTAKIGGHLFFSGVL